MSDLTVRFLTHDRMPLLYRLAQFAMPEVSLGAWHDFASARIARIGLEPGGILVTEDRDGYVLGFASYLISDNLRHGRILIADNLVAAGIVERQRETVLSLLLEAMEDLARDHLCNAVHIESEALEAVTLAPHAHQLLGTAGYSRELLSRCKCLQPGA